MTLPGNTTAAAADPADGVPKRDPHPLWDVRPIRSQQERSFGTLLAVLAWRYPWYLYREGQWHETLNSGAGHGLLFHFQAPFWSDIASAFQLVVLGSRLAALWRLQGRN